MTTFLAGAPSVQQSPVPPMRPNILGSSDDRRVPTGQRAFLISTDAGALGSALPGLQLATFSPSSQLSRLSPGTLTRQAKTLGRGEPVFENGTNERRTYASRLAGTRLGNAGFGSGSSAAAHCLTQRTRLCSSAQNRASWLVSRRVLPRPSPEPPPREDRLEVSRLTG